MTEKFKLPIIVQGTKKTNSSGTARVNTEEYATDAQELAKLIAEWIVMDADKSFLELHIGEMKDGQVRYNDPESSMVANIKVDVSLVCQGLRGVGSAEKRHGQEPSQREVHKSRPPMAEIEVLVCPAHMKHPEVPTDYTVIEFLTRKLKAMVPEARIVVRRTSQKTRKDSAKPGIPYSSYFVSNVYSDKIMPFLNEFFEGAAKQVKEPRCRS